MVDPSLVCPSVTAPAAHSPNIWLLGRGPDLLLVIATPALVIPAMFGCLGLGLSTAAQLNEWVMTFGAQGHHLPGMVRAYGDRQLFHRFRFRFIAAPLFWLLLMTCAVYELEFNLHGLSLGYLARRLKAMDRPVMMQNGLYRRPYGPA